MHEYMLALTFLAFCFRNLLRLT